MQRHVAAATLARVLTLVVALAACGWFVLAIRQSRDVNQARALVSGGRPLTPSRVHHTSSLLSDAGLLNPDRQVDVLRAQLDLDQGDRAGARLILKRVVAKEPDNLIAWFLLAHASVGDLKDFYAAAFRIEQLMPTVPPRR